MEADRVPLTAFPGSDLESFLSLLDRAQASYFADEYAWSVDERTVRRTIVAVGAWDHAVEFTFRNGAIVAESEM